MTSHFSDSRPSSILSHRPRTSSTVDDASLPGRGPVPDMKRTASQTFSPLPTSTAALRDGDHMASIPGLGAVYENHAFVESPQSTPRSHGSSSLSQSIKRQIRRRLSTSSRRPSLCGVFDHPTTSDPQAALKNALPRLTVQHQDSGFPTPSLYGEGPSGDQARYNPQPVPVPQNYPQPLPVAPVMCPGYAARAAAAAANNDRIKKQEEQSFAYHLEDALLAQRPMDGVLKDSESGVGMSCESPVDEMDLVDTEKRIDFISLLPTEINETIFANLDIASLVNAECVSRDWRRTASSNHVWRQVFLRRFEPQVHVSPTPITMGGAGIGKFRNEKPLPGQDWREMYKAQNTIARRWRAGAPKAIYLNGHTDSVYCCQFDEHKIITGSRDRTIRVWDINTFECTKVIGGPSTRPSPNTPAPLDVHPTNTVRNNPSVNGTAEGDAIFHVPRDFHEASILCLQYDDRIMVTGSSDHTCIVWDITKPNFEPITRLEGHSAGVLDVALDAKHIVSCSKDASINIWDRKTFRHIRTLTGHRGPVNAVQLRGNLLVSASGDGMAKLWNLDTGSWIKEFPSEDRGLAAVEFSDDTRYLLAGGNDHVIYKFDTHSAQLLHTSAKHGGLVRSLFLDSRNSRVISGSYDQSIRVADFETGEVMGVFRDWTTSWILSAKADYRRVVATSQDGRCLILDFGYEVPGVESLSGLATA